MRDPADPSDGVALRDERGYKLIRFDDPLLAEELYRVSTDLNETNNLLPNPATIPALGSFYGLTIELGKYTETPAAAPKVTDPLLSGTQFSLRVEKTSATAYTLLRSATLDYGTWLPVSGASILDEGATLLFTDPSASGSKLFYRVVAE